MFGYCRRYRVNPSPPSGAGGPPALQTAIDSWQNRHAFAREALLKCLEYSELNRVVDVEESTPAIWNRFREEYGHVLDIEYVRPDVEFHAPSRRTIKHRSTNISTSLLRCSIYVITWAPTNTIVYMAWLSYIYYFANAFRKLNWGAVSTIRSHQQTFVWARRKTKFPPMEWARQ